MSSFDDERDIILHNYLHILAVSFLFYDHVITLGQEVEHIWKKLKNRSSYCFLVNRYLGLLGNIAVLSLGFTTLSSQSCRRYNVFRQFLLIINQVIVCILLTLRIYALYGCSFRILAFCSGAAVTLAIVAVYMLFGQKSSPSQEASGCHIAFSHSSSLHMVMAWEALLIYDFLIFCLTVFKTWRTRKYYVVTRINVPLISLIHRDGALYFAVMAVCNLANIMTYYFAGPYLRGGLATFASSMSVTLMSRLMLNLHRTAELGIMSRAQHHDSHYYTSGVWTETLDVLIFSDSETRSHSTVQPPTVTA